MRLEEKTSIHLTRKSVFSLGVHPRKLGLMVTIKEHGFHDSGRIAKAEQVSKGRWHLEVRVATKEEIDAELLGGLKRAYELCG